MSERIGIVIGWEESFPQAFMARVNETPGFKAELAKFGGTRDQVFMPLGEGIKCSGIDGSDHDLFSSGFARNRNIAKCTAPALPCFTISHCAEGEFTSRSAIGKRHSA